ncbi:hypothetical protein [Escherichia coli]|uniref:hypothetical protein n=2 Tax=Escherichia coli TaxID=562 RepID=UPI0003BACCB1|nr:hypothetical protein [Escherichia coli]ESD76495.1 hypothetical protein HMPREF1608_01344 [Escherichia coli 908525]EGO3787695.1 hypothetical protein [Escherichia coli]EHK5381349.1 hypothetical protein [Escherichia coli]EII3505358.1 hypothetical protein [Escherichia coli]
MDETTDKEKAGNPPACIYCGSSGHSGFVAAHNYLLRDKETMKIKPSGTKKSSRLPIPHTRAPPRHAAPLPFADIFYPSIFSQDMHVRDEEYTHDYCPVSPVPGKNSNQHLHCYSTK